MATASRLTASQRKALGEEIDAIRQEVVDDLGESDTSYINRLIRTQRALETTGRGLFHFGWFPPAWFGGVATLGLSKILDNMEIGHNIMHGQYDWTNNPALASADFEWDSAAPAKHWKHSHNHLHHTHTNILGMDRDIGYGLMRISEDQQWRPTHLANPLMALWLAGLFQWGVMLHELEIERITAGEIPLSDKEEVIREMLEKATKQVAKDYLLFPALTGPMFVSTAAGNAAANLMRNIWAFSIIFCGHFPDGAEVFDPERLATESRGAWYERQILGSANIEGGPLFHILSGNLSFQIEHHLFPDLPANRYAEIAPKVQEICERYGLPYNAGGFTRQLGSVARKILRLALPGGSKSEQHRPVPEPKKQDSSTITAAGKAA